MPMLPRDLSGGRPSTTRATSPATITVRFAALIPCARRPGAAPHPAPRLSPRARRQQCLVLARHGRGGQVFPRLRRPARLLCARAAGRRAARRGRGLPRRHRGIARAVRHIQRGRLPVLHPAHCQRRLHALQVDDRVHRRHVLELPLLCRAAGRRLSLAGHEHRAARVPRDAPGHRERHHALERPLGRHALELLCGRGAARRPAAALSAAAGARGGRGRRERRSVCPHS